MNDFEKLSSRKMPFVVGVVADTHIPDRVAGLHPNLLTELQNQKVDIIFHAGDISSQRVLDTLAQVAPVRAVKGNRDFLIQPSLPMWQMFEINGKRVVLTHGHLTSAIYWYDKVQYMTRGYTFDRYQARFKRFFPNVQVIVFGHTHEVENRWLEGRLYFNPGSASYNNPRNPDSHFGVLRFSEDGSIESDVIGLAGWKIQGREWVKS